MGDIPSNHLLALVCFQPPNGKNTCIYVQGRPKESEHPFQMALAAQDVRNASGAYNKKCARLWPYLIQFDVTALRPLQAHINESKCKPDPSLLSSPGRLSESKTFFLLRGRKKMPFASSLDAAIEEGGRRNPR